MKYLEYLKDEIFGNLIVTWIIGSFIVGILMWIVLTLFTTNNPFLIFVCVVVTFNPFIIVALITGVQNMKNDYAKWKKSKGYDAKLGGIECEN